MLKHAHTFEEKMNEEYKEYKNKVKSGETKINTKGLFAYDIIQNIINGKLVDEELYNLMWDNQINILEGNKSNV